MSIDISRLGAAAQKQILRKLREADVKKIEQADRERIAAGGVNATPAVRENNNKVHAEQTDGYASKKEARRAEELRLMQQAGKISDLQEQVKYVLVPAMYEDARGNILKDWDEKPKHKLEQINGPLKLLERSLCYVADFVYADTETGKTVVEDVKGYKKSNAAIYRIFVGKRKLMLYIYGIRVREV